jgi:ubiquinone/menaquinone biosynthesis C-methylase UbiE
MRDLGLRINIDVVNDNVALADKTVVDVGCGSMVFSKQLAEQGARVIAIDPDSVQAEMNRGQEIDGIEFFETGADQLPVQDSSVDGVFFAYSLHHVPAGIHEAVFKEIGRVIKPSGFLYVIEPTDCPLNDVMMLFHDEQQVRAAAQAALTQLGASQFDSVEEFTYHSIREFESFEDFANQFSSKTFNTAYSAEDVWRDEVRERFENLGAPDYRFNAPKRVWFGQNSVRS